MARIRTIKPEFPQSESMGRVSRESRLCFILLWTLADDAGRLRGNSRMLASLLYPYDDDAAKKIDGWLSELEREHCIQRYVVDGDRYLAVCQWERHQKIDKPTPSKMPEPTIREESANAREDSRGLDGASGKFSLDQGRDQGEEGRGLAGSDGGFAAFWAAYPNRKAKQDAVKAWGKLKPDDTLQALILEAIAQQSQGEDWRKEGGRFVPHAATWINGQRWLDEGPESAQGSLMVGAV